MKKPFLLLLFALISDFSFGQQKTEADFTKIRFNAFSTIKLNFKNFNDTLLLTSQFLTWFPAEEIEADPIRLYGEGTIYIQLKIQHPEKVELSVVGFYTDSIKDVSGIPVSDKDLDVSCFLLPFDTLEVIVDNDSRNQQKQSIHFNGKYALLSDYYRAKDIYFKGNNFVWQKGLLANQETDLELFKTAINNITSMELTFLDHFLQKNILPAWFSDFERSDLEYSAQSLKLSEPMLMEYNRGTANHFLVLPKPGDYFSFAEELPLNNENATLSIYYILSLREYFYNYYFPKQMTTMVDDSIKRNVLAGFIAFSVSHLSPYISDLLIAREFDVTTSFRKIPDNDFNLLISAVKDSSLKSYMEVRHAMELLKKGDDAPSFYLKDEIDNYHSIKELKGNVVFLSFWFTGCKPCIKAFPDENNLIELFKNEKVKVVSICMESSEDSWKKGIQNHKLNALNLFANGNWAKILKESYDLSAFPHYVLIDQNGKIVDNKCARPGQGAEEEIRNILGK